MSIFLLVLQALWTWTAVIIIVSLLIGSGGVGVMSMTPPDFTLAKVCFSLGMALLAAKVGEWLIVTPMSASNTQRIVAGVILFGLIGGFWIASIQWVRAREPVLPLSNPAKDEVANCAAANLPRLSDPRLRECALEFALKLRRLLDDNRLEMMQVDDKARERSERAKTGKDKDRIGKDAFQRKMMMTEQTLQKYRDTYRVDAILLRDELNRRVPIGNKSNDLGYEIVVNPFGIESVAVDLERMAKLLRS
jgi:hypothetical protein